MWGQATGCPLTGCELKKVDETPQPCGPSDRSAGAGPHAPGPLPPAGGSWGSRRFEGTPLPDSASPRAQPLSPSPRAGRVGKLRPTSWSVPPTADRDLPHRAEQSPSPPPGLLSRGTPACPGRDPIRKENCLSLVLTGARQGGGTFEGLCLSPAAGVHPQK